jgi:CheY-like chemotaxis protein
MKKKVLIIDDEPDFVELTRMRLEANGYAVLAASNGREGLDVARRESPNLILLDVMMPEMDGFETLKALRSGPPGGPNADCDVDRPRRIESAV